MNKEQTIKQLLEDTRCVIHEAIKLLLTLKETNAERVTDAELVDVGFQIDRIEQAVEDVRQTLHNCEEY